MIREREESIRLVSLRSYWSLGSWGRHPAHTRENSVNSVETLGTVEAGPARGRARFTAHGGTRACRSNEAVLQTNKKIRFPGTQVCEVGVTPSA